MRRRALFVFCLALPLVSFAQDNGETSDEPPDYSQVDYQSRPPFSLGDEKLQRELRDALRRTTAAGKKCPRVVKMPGHDRDYDQETNVCDPKAFKGLVDVVSRLAPSLNKEALTVWLVGPGGAAGKELVIGQLDNPGNSISPEASFWLLRPGHDRYDAIYAGRFLAGRFLGERLFGTRAAQRAAFISYQNCTECEPTVLAAALDFDAADGPKRFTFSFGSNHMINFDDGFEYALSGVEGDPETAIEIRTLPPSEEGPHLLEWLHTTGGGQPKSDEWRAYTCAGYRCDFQMHKGEPPAPFKQLWAKAKAI